MKRREFLAGSLAGLATVWLQGSVSWAKESKKEKPDSSPLPATPVRDAEVQAMELAITYTTRVIQPSKRAKGVRLWIPLAKGDEAQEVTSFSVESPYPFRFTQEPFWGNQMVFVEAPAQVKPYAVEVRYTLKRLAAGPIPQVLDPEAQKKYLFLARREKWNRDVTAYTDQVVGDAKGNREICRRIYDALIKDLTYDKTIPGCGMGDSIWMLEHKRGRCDDYHALFRTMAIYKGVPTRFEQGIALPYPSQISKSGQMEGDCSGAHCWSRFYADGEWVPVDASEASKRSDLREYFFGRLTPNRFKVSTGRDIVLSPAQEGPPLNTFPYTYGEADGIPMIYGHHYRNRIRYEVLRIV